MSWLDWIYARQRALSNPLGPLGTIPALIKPDFDISKGFEKVPTIGAPVQGINYLRSVGSGNQNQKKKAHQKAVKVLRHKTTKGGRTRKPAKKRR